MKASPQTTSTLVGRVAIHEASHSCVCLALHGDAGFVYAGEVGGAAIVQGNTPVAEMLILAAGVSGEVAVMGFETTLPRQELPTVVSDEDFTAPALAAAFLRTHAETFSKPGLSDMERFDKLLEDLIIKGRIRNRKDLHTRWWWKARRWATRIAEQHRPAIRAVAAALATRRGIDGNELQNILRGIGSTLARVPGVSPSPSHWTEGGGGVPAMMPRQTGGTANG